MARDQAKKTSDSRGKKKAERHSPTTKANKQRAAETRARRLDAAERRRHSKTYTDPRTGTKTRRDVTGTREAQSRKVAIKRKQRENFNKLSDKWKKAHRSAGALHTTPVDLI